jgi:enoyl-CoA hydratase/carnithine racemase
MGDFVSVEKHDGIAILTLNRPEQLNAIGEHAHCADIVAAIENIGDDPSINVAILTGSGRAFSAGGDLQRMKDRNGIGPLDSPAATRANYRQGIQRIPRAFQNLEVPIIAAVNGHAVGVGCDIACLCDIRIASDRAKFAASFIKMGLVPGDGGAWVLPRVVGFSKAAEMLFTGDPLTADQALACGLVSQVVPADKLMDTARALAQRIVVNPAKALRMTKRLLLHAQQLHLDEVLEMSAAMQALAHETEDHAEAVSAFLEKRSPSFTGR